MSRRVPKLPFKLYAVNSCFGDVELEEVTVVRITPTKWWFGESSKGSYTSNSGGLAFGCRTGCEPFMYSLTARAAWQKFRKEAVEEKERAERQIAAADKALEKL